MLAMRLYFAVHTFLNLYSETQGYRIDIKNSATKQTHLMTLDKQVLEMPLSEAFNPEAKGVRTFSKRQGLWISDFDSWMADGNPLVV